MAAAQSSSDRLMSTLAYQPRHIMNGMIKVARPAAFAVLSEALSILLSLAAWMLSRSSLCTGYSPC